MRKKLTKAQAAQVIDILEELYPEAKAELDHENPFELLIATILSAQCTDVRVNQVTKPLFQELKTPEDYLALGELQLAERIRSCGFYNSKSKNIIGACTRLVSVYHSQVPDSIEELMTLPGVGKKTANVVVSNAFGIPAIAVDTHVFRVSNRIGLVDGKDVVETEEQLMRVIPKQRWTKMHHCLIFHGRRVCKARSPQCEVCAIAELCLELKRRRNHVAKQKKSS